MEKIEYVEIVPLPRVDLISVKLLDGKAIGVISKVKNGYRYYPNGVSDKFAGEIFNTIEEVKESLE